MWGTDSKKRSREPEQSVKTAQTENMHTGGNQDGAKSQNRGKRNRREGDCRSWRARKWERARVRAANASPQPWKPCTFCSRRILLHLQINSPHGQGGCVGEVGGEWLVGNTENTKKPLIHFQREFFLPDFLI